VPTKKNPTPNAKDGDQWWREMYPNAKSANTQKAVQHIVGKTTDGKPIDSSGMVNKFDSLESNALYASCSERDKAAIRMIVDSNGNLPAKWWIEDGSTPSGFDRIANANAAWKEINKLPAPTN
jgi:hypothetical protein